jgi:hypothetical protein
MPRLRLGSDLGATQRRMCVKFPGCQKSHQVGVSTGKLLPFIVVNMMPYHAFCAANSRLPFLRLVPRGNERSDLILDQSKFSCIIRLSFPSATPTELVPTLFKNGLG